MIITILIVTNLLTLTALIYTLSTNREQGQEDICETLYGASNPGMPISMAHTLIRTYGQNIWAGICDNSAWKTLVGNNGLNSDGTKVCDARSVWFSLEEIDRFICKIKTNCLEKSDDIDNMQPLGVRIYFGQYPSITDTQFWSRLPVDSLPARNRESYAGKHTVVLVPTYSAAMGGARVNMDFDPYHFTGTAPTPISTLYSPQAGQAAMALADPDPTVLMLNHGGIIPPPYPADSYAAMGACLIG